MHSFCLRRPHKVRRPSLQKKNRGGLRRVRSPLNLPLAKLIVGILQVYLFVLFEAKLIMGTLQLRCILFYLSQNWAYGNAQVYQKELLSIDFPMVNMSEGSNPICWCTIDCKLFLTSGLQLIGRCVYNYYFQLVFQLAMTYGLFEMRNLFYFKLLFQLVMAFTVIIDWEMHISFSACFSTIGDVVCCQYCRFEDQHVARTGFVFDNFDSTSTKQSLYAIFSI